MRRAPPSSPLFPYTTLFRSQIVQPEDLEDRSQDAAFVRARGGTVFFGPVYFGPEAEPYISLAVPLEPFPGDVVGVLSAEDRKSTRLNSSHVAISYAVFCLKK